MAPRKSVKSEPSSSSESASNSRGGESDYLAKRARNNEAVKRSREKAREKAKETTDKVTKLKTENERLEEKVKLLSKELDFLKNIFMAHAGSAHGFSINDLEIQELLNADVSADTSQVVDYMTNPNFVEDANSNSNYS